MKKGILFTLGIAGLVGFVASATAIQSFNDSNLNEAKAEGSDIYSLIGLDGDWSTDADMTYQNNVYTITKTLSRNDTFKIRKNHAWGDGEKSYSAPSGDASDFFESDGSGSNNYKCLLNGEYVFTYEPDKAGEPLTINFTSGETYSYVLTAWSDYTCAHIYDNHNDDDDSNDTPYNAWANSPSVNDVGGGQAYNVKVTWDGNDYYGLYRISDRYLFNYTHLILKKDGGVGEGYENRSDKFVLSGKSKVYSSINAGARPVEDNSSAIYGVAAFLWDLAVARSSHVSSLNGLNYGYSFCGISGSSANSLVSAYSELKKDPNALTILSNSSFNTYDFTSTEVGAETTEIYRDDYTIPEIMDEVARNNGASLELSQAATKLNAESNFVLTWLLLGAGLSVMVLGGIFLIRRKVNE